MVTVFMGYMRPKTFDADYAANEFLRKPVKETGTFKKKKGWWGGGGGIWGGGGYGEGAGAGRNSNGISLMLCMRNTPRTVCEYLRRVCCMLISVACVIFAQQ